MNTIINNPADRGEGSGVGFAVGVLAVVLLGVLFFFYGLPLLRGTTPAPTQPAAQPGGDQNIEVNVPLPATGGTNDTEATE